MKRIAFLALVLIIGTIGMAQDGAQMKFGKVKHDFGKFKEDK